jgi:hypothetical protein
MAWRHMPETWRAVEGWRSCCWRGSEGRAGQGPRVVKIKISGFQWKYSISLFMNTQQIFIKFSFRFKINFKANFTAHCNFCQILHKPFINQNKNFTSVNKKKICKIFAVCKSEKTGFVWKKHLEGGGAEAGLTASVQEVVREVEDDEAGHGVEQPGRDHRQPEHTRPAHSLTIPNQGSKQGCGSGSGFSIGSVDPDPGGQK